MHSSALYAVLTPNAPVAPTNDTKHPFASTACLSCQNSTANCITNLSQQTSHRLFRSLDRIT